METSRLPPELLRLLAPVIAKRAWPKIDFGEKRAIPHAEHQKIIEREKNPERELFYELCWHVGGSQAVWGGARRIIRR